MDKLEKHIIRELSREGHSSKVFSDPLSRIAKGTDAGIYRLIPRLVVQVNNETDVIAVLKVCRNAGVSLTFKAGGTSLSGQTVTDSVLVETGPGFTKYSTAGRGEKINLEPGITGGFANAILASDYRKIGPCPASIASAKIGGIIGNNASGASYGIATNSYNTLEGLRLVFSDGSILDSRDAASRENFIRGHQNLLGSVSKLSADVKSNPEFFEKIRHKYQLKNTTGYGLNSLIDFEDPVDILWHLIIGSEGTLAYVSDATYRTVNSYPKSSAALILLPDIREACKAIGPLLKCEVSAAELMDRNALLSVQEIPGIPDIIRNPPEYAVALLIDTSAQDEGTLNNQVAEIRKALADIRTLYPVVFITDTREYNRIWKVRKGLFTSAAATRPGGTSCLIEDVAFRPEVLPDALVALRSLISNYGYKGSVMWGHLLDGNVHFVIMPDFRSDAEIEKYRKFMSEFVSLTVHEFDGSLKAEHGTGRNMAPFVKEEWGSGLYSVMKNIKQLFDPDNILNPGVILNDDPLIHIKNLKPVPVVDETIDKCIECGFCENDCPSKNITLTPRQRIVAYREIFRNTNIPHARSYLNDLKTAFSYSADETCATDGLCALACPVNINTGQLIKEIRWSNHGKTSKAIASFIGNNMNAVTAVMRVMLNVIYRLQLLTGKKFMQASSGLLHRISFHTIPLWNPYMPKAAGRIKSKGLSVNSRLRVVYFPSCINRTFGTSGDYGRNEPEIAFKITDLLHKAGYDEVIPEKIDDLCCGMAFDSKGYTETGLKKARQLEAALLQVSEGGKIPVICEMSPCLLRMKDMFSGKLELYEPVEFILKYLVSNLNFKKLDRTVTIHSTCSSIKMGLTDDLIRLARMCCENVVVPLDIGCCGWAGDRGFTVPELNESALMNLKKQLPEGVKQGYSTSRTCEIGLSLYSGISYKSIVYLVDEATEALMDN